MEELNLNAFTPVSKDQWKLLAKKQLKDKDPDEQLKWLNDAGVTMEAYYDTSDLKDLEYLTDFFSSINSHKWKLYERIKESTPGEANAKAIVALMGGCDGVIFDNVKIEDLEAMLQDINVEICDVSLISSDSFGSLKDLSGFQHNPEGNCVNSEEYENPVLQLKDLITNISDKKYIRRTAIKDFFLEIASLRALRYLLSEKGLKDPHIHTHIPIHSSEEHQWFLNTSAGLSSVLGGSHSIDLPTAIGDSRISRNTGNLIREESGITDYTDQCGGSFYVEVLTHKIIQEVKA